eukprot:gnl/MRDRNA2_/MRDRNA2_135975_c0_seq1.p1 gnl/MRDRNA2_/MRDRNA2_135975_c0~~gnl/MRDRNA2_/MRDRNA2_135975_c0_seq1.p1  ORF type:complete len:205 (-),score=50.69 gnl/MRDRNA2_/MRDRNA2_135975_c0_seq1:161-775(-)
MADRMVRGTYESAELGMIKDLDFFEDDVVVELGGCLGVIAVATNRRLPPSARHVVIEANPVIIPFLEHNRAVNNCTFVIEHCMVSDTSDGSFTSFNKAVAGSAHRMDNIESNPVHHQVPVKPSSELPPNTSVLIVDIEGGEKELFEQALPQLRSIRLIMVEIHEFLMYKGFEKEVREVLVKHGFSQVKHEETNFIFVRSGGAPG